MGKFDKLSIAELEELKGLLNQVDAKQYEGTYHGRSGINAEFAFSCDHSTYQKILTTAVRQVNYHSIDGEVDIANGFIHIIAALVYCHIDQFGRDSNIYY